MNNKQTTKCPECGGDGYTLEDTEAGYATREVDCDYCDGKGTGTAETVSEDKRNFVRVRRSSDNAELDFTWQDIIKGKVLNWVNKNGTADGFVAIEYNPSGNGNDIVHTTVVHQPRLVTSGVLNTLNGKPALEKAYESPNYGCEYSSSCTGTTETTLEEKIKEILGLEVSPHGEPNMFLISDSEGNIEEGIDFSDEVKQLEELVSLAVQQERERCLKLVEEKQFEINIDEYLPKVREWEKGYDKPFDDGYEQFRKDIIKAINQHNE